MLKETEWQNSNGSGVEEWYNKRIMDSFISSDEIDLHGDHIDPAIFEKILPWLQNYGYYEWMHEGITIGKILGWRYAKDPEDGEIKPMIKVGIHDYKTSNIPLHDEVWTKIQDLGLKGMSSIKGIANGQELKWAGDERYNDITDIGCWAVGYVLEDAANTGANITFVDEMAKEGMIAKSKEAHDRIVHKATGEGQGVGGERQSVGGTDTCYCHDCSISIKHKRGEPCNDLKCPKCGNPLTGIEKSKNHSLKNEINQMEKEVTKLEKEATALTEEKELRKKLEEMVLKVKTMQDKLTKQDEPPEAEPEPEGEEEPTDEGDSEVIAELEADIDQLATAIEALEPGTPEAVAEAVEIAADVKVDADTDDYDESEMKKNVEALTKKLTDMTEKMEKYMSKPVKKTGLSPTQSKSDGFGDDTIASLTKSFQGTKAEQAKIWKDHGFNRTR